LELLDEHGMAGLYDFVYLPCDFYRDANLGYAFVNLVDRRAVDLVWKALDGFSEWRLPTAKVCQVRWSGPHQGFKAHVERYRNSPVMHRAVPDLYKPVIFKDGVRKPFPRPT
ncbi:mei2, partial [Symbiodinium pilosum]